MRKLVVIAALGMMVSGCAGALQGAKHYMSTDDALQKEAELKKAYSACLKRNGNDETRCKKEKDELLEQQEWNEMEESG
jgi:hypothetical protein